MRPRGHARARWQRSRRICRYGLSVSGQRARSAVAVAHRSALPRVPGIPWWAAILLAGTAAAVGFAYDAGSGDKELSGFFAFCYVTGCVLAVLAVRQSGVFTAVIQPPLILFGVVPAAYFLFHGATIGGIKDILINCGYPLIERFPLMFFTSAAVLVIGLVRWYLGTLTRRSATDEPTEAKTSRRAASRLAAEETTTLDAVDAAPRRPKRERAPRRPERERESVSSEDAPRRTRTGAAAGASRSRHTRPPETDLAEPAARPRRRQGPPVDAPDDPPTEIRRRSRAGASREPRRDLPPVDARGSRERPERRERPRPSERREGFERPERSERRRRPPVREGYEPREPFETYDPFESRSSNGNNGSHHPVSRVRYRGSDQEPDVTPRSRPRRPADSDLDSWEFDV